MENLTHQIITKYYPENLDGGIMICGINFGYSVEDEALEKAGVVAEPEPLSFFSDKAVNNTRFRNRVLAWLSSCEVDPISRTLYCSIRRSPK